MESTDRSPIPDWHEVSTATTENLMQSLLHLDKAYKRVDYELRRRVTFLVEKALGIKLGVDESPQDASGDLSHRYQLPQVHSPDMSPVGYGGLKTTGELCFLLPLGVVLEKNSTLKEADAITRLKAIDGVTVNIPDRSGYKEGQWGYGMALHVVFTFDPRVLLPCKETVPDPNIELYKRLKHIHGLLSGAGMPE